MANLATNFQIWWSKWKNLVALVPVSGAISRPALQNHSGYQEMNFVRLSHDKVTFDVDRDIRPQHCKSPLIDEVIVYGSLFVAH